MVPIKVIGWTGDSSSRAVEDVGVRLLWLCVYCHVEVWASGWSIVQRISTEFGVSEGDREASIMKRPWPTTGCCAMGGGDRMDVLKDVVHLYILYASILVSEE
jgi:hypothetical protein